MGYTSNLSFVRLKPAVLATSTIAMGAAGIFLILKGPATQVAPVGDKVFECQTGSGAQRCRIDDRGNAAFSGSLSVQGVVVGTGGNVKAGQGLTYTASANALSLSNTFSGTSLEIMGTSSGRILHAADELRSSGSLNVEGATNIHGTLSGNLVRAIQISPIKMQSYFQSGSMLVSSGSTQFMIPPYASGWTLSYVQMDVRTAGTTNATKVQLRQLDKAGRGMLSTPVQVDSAEKTSLTAATAYVINTATDDVHGGEMITVDVTAISSTAPKDPSIWIWLSAP